MHKRKPVYATEEWQELSADHHDSSITEHIGNNEAASFNPKAHATNNPLLSLLFSFSHVILQIFFTALFTS